MKRDVCLRGADGLTTSRGFCTCASSMSITLSVRISMMKAMLMLYLPEQNLARVLMQRCLKAPSCLTSVTFVVAVSCAIGRGRCRLEIQASLSERGLSSLLHTPVNGLGGQRKVESVPSSRATDPALAALKTIYPSSEVRAHHAHYPEFRHHTQRYSDDLDYTQ